MSTFGMEIDIEFFYKLIAIHTQSTQKKNFIYISLQYL